MDNDPEVTREQMDETRASLSEKMETLEQHVVDTMQGATTAVGDTIENVKEAVNNVKDTFSLQLQIQQYPWAIVAGSLALGYLGGYLLFRRGSPQFAPNGWSQPAPPLENPRITESQNGTVKGHHPAVAGANPTQAAAPGPSDSSWLSEANDLFAAEITTLKRLAIGTVLGLARDAITQSFPEQVKTPLANVIDRITVKLGGEPTPIPEGVTERPAQARTAGSSSVGLSENRLMVV